MWCLKMFVLVVAPEPEDSNTMGPVGTTMAPEDGLQSKHIGEHETIFY